MKHVKIDRRRVPSGRHSSRSSPAKPVMLQRQRGDNAAESLSLLLSTVQPKMKIGDVNEPQERKAEEAADLVMAMPEPAVQRKPG